jgi:signal transduction histidine kinase
LVGGVVLYREVLSELEDEARNRLGGWIRSTADLIENGEPADSLTNKNIVVLELPVDAPIMERRIQDTTGVFPPRRRGLDRVLTISESRIINGHHYLISASDFIAEQDEIFVGVRNSLVIITAVLIVLVMLMNLVVSRQILKPFQHIVHSIKAFSLKQQQPIKGRATNTLELKELNYFLENMTRRAVDDYRILKEFSENASHEIQTPLTIIRGKLELLMDAGVTEAQSVHVNAIYDAVQKLSSVNHSLVLLTKLENQEYNSRDKTNISMLLDNLLSSFHELLDLKRIRITKQIQPEVNVAISYSLAEILLNNLIGNAIRHNTVDGTIDIRLTKNELLITNTGNPLTVAPAELFKRFRKGNQSAASTGLGLSIVKQICDLANIHIQYLHNNGLHSLQLSF